MRKFLVAGLTTLSLLGGSLITPVKASSHREAPSTAVDRQADATDVYAFVDPNDPTRVNFVANFIPFQNPAGGPNFERFDDNIIYAIRIDNNGDAVTDIQIQFRFRTEVRDPNTFLYNTGQVTSLDDPDLNIRQFYTVTLVRGSGTTAVTETLATDVPVPPVNIGPRSTPDYETNLAQPAIRNVTTGSGRVTFFAGQRDDPFFVDLGSVFDLLGLRPFNSAHRLPRTTQPGYDYVAGFNVSSIIVQAPISAVTSTPAALSGPTDPRAVISVYSATSRQAVITFNPGGGASFSGNFVQTSRLGNPLINEVIVPLAAKDRFNNSLPGGDIQFAPAVLDPEPARLIRTLYPSLTIPQAPRNDIATIFLTGIPGLNVQINTSGTPNPDPVFTGQPANTVPQERLRLNLAIPPTATPNRNGFLGGDNAGFPNGRRLTDDVVDIELRALAGGTALTPATNVSPNNILGDGVNGNDRPFLTQFPYVASPYSGYDAPNSLADTTDTTPANPPVRTEPTPRP